MCGIVGYIGKQKALPVLLDGLKTLEYRGYDSAGVAYLLNSNVILAKKEGKLAQLEQILNLDTPTYAGIGHTRWATHGSPNQINAHPHRVNQITLVHNGIIENDHDLKKELEAQGYQFQSNTDTEVAAACIDSLYQITKDPLQALKLAQQKLKGSYAFGILFDCDLEHIYAMRKNSPLIVAHQKDGNFIASDVPAILKYTNQYQILENDEIAVLGTEIHIYNQNLEPVQHATLTFEGDTLVAQKNGYQHFMLKEIMEQQEVIQKTLASFHIEDMKSFIQDVSLFQNIKHIDIVACGSAMHAGLVGKEFIEKYAYLPVTVTPASEYRYQSYFYPEGNFVIVISQSGETADTLSSLRLAKSQGIKTLAIVNVFGSSIAREADYVYYTKAGVEIAVATTKAYLAQLSVLALVALKIALAQNKIATEEVKNILLQIKDESNLIASLCKQETYEQIAKQIYQEEHIFFLGRGIDYALSMEGSLKLKEISYIHSEAYAAGELKHGTISLIQNQTKVFAILSDSHISEKTISNIKEVKARGAYVIVLIQEGLTIDSEAFDQKIVIPKASFFVEPLLMIVPLQLIAYHVANLRNCDIDKPRNLAKSVTVE